MSVQPVERKLAAILAADVVGYSRLMGQDEAGTLARLRGHRRELIDPSISEHKGRIVKTTGDGILIEFPSVVEAVACAVTVQRGMTERNATTPEGDRIVFRIGVNLGDIIVEDNDIHGDGVNVAARLEAISEPGGICISGTVRDHIGDRLDLAFEDMGEQALKNIVRPVRAFAIRLGGKDPTPAASENSAAPLPLPDKPSIAVLPFQNMSGDPEQEYFADGMVEEIITALSRIRWLFVIARNSSFTYKGQAIDVKRIGRELGVRYVLEGSVRKGGNRVRITAQLIDAASGAHVWAERYDRQLDDIFALQDEITASVASIIEPALAEAEQQRVLRKPPERLDAWEAYQRGLWHLYRYGADENRIAQTFFRQAIALDSNYAPGHYGYSLALFWDFWLYSTRSFSDVMSTFLEEARIGVSLDDKDAMAHVVLTWMLTAVGEWEPAITEARVALSLNPNSAWAISTVGAALTFGGYHEEAIAHCRWAMRASPHDPLTWAWFFWIGVSQFNSRDFLNSIETMRQVIHLQPQHHYAYLSIAISLAHLDRLDEARDALERWKALFPEAAKRYEQRPPWTRPEDYALRVEGRRLLGWEPG